MRLSTKVCSPCLPALVILMVAANSAALRLPAASPQFLFGISTKVAGVDSDGVLEHSPSLTPDELELFFRRGDDLYEARRASKHDAFGQPARIDELSVAGVVESGPSISADGLTLYFHRGTEPGTFLSDSNDIWTASRPSRDAPFGSPIDLSEGWGTTGLFRFPDVSADGLNLYLTQWTTGDGDIYVATRASTDQPWDAPLPVPELAIGGVWQGRSGVSADGRQLFFEDWSHVETNRGGDSLGNIAVVTRPSLNDSWSDPVNLGDAINWGGYNTEPYLTHDGSTLYYWRAQNLPDGSNLDPASMDIYQAPVLPFAVVPLAGQGSAYQQTFDTLGSSSKDAGQAFPVGWTFTANDVIFNSATTQKFPAASHQYAGAFNAGSSGDADRALATGETQLETGELQFRAHVNGGPVQAVRLSVDVEAWQVFKNQTVTPGEAAFNVILEADTGKGFEKLADLGRATTGEKLVFPEIGSGLNGNDPANRGSFDSGPLNVSIPEGATLRLRFVPPSETDVVGWTFGLDNLSLHTAAPGDANVDGKVDLTDFGTLKANFGTEGHFTDGDFSGNGQIDLSDLGLLKENFGKSAAAAVPEPATWGLLVGGAMFWAIQARSGRARRRPPERRRLTPFKT